VKVLVTGGAGFIGSNVCRRLATRSEVTEIVAFDDLTTGFESNLADCAAARLVVGDVRDGAAMRAAADGAQAIVHLAARPSVPLSIADPVASHQVNVTGTVEVLQIARQTGAYVIVASSSAVYGDSPVSVKSEHLAVQPMSPYGVTKVATEGYAAAYQYSFGVPTLALRFFNVYGPGQPAGHAYAAVVPAFVSAALSGQPLQVFGDGRQIRDFVFVDTVADALTDAVLRRVTSPGPVNLATGEPTDLLTLVRELEEVLGRDLELEFLDARVGDIVDSRADPTTFRDLFPGVVPVDRRTGLSLTVQWWQHRLGTHD
jgi:UDP-glucose 4-epimerase